MKKIIFLFGVIVLFSQCTFHHTDSAYKMKEIDTLFLNMDIKNIVRQYIKTYPAERYIALNYNIDLDTNKIEEGKAYFSLSEFDKELLEYSISDERSNLPLSYFFMDGRKIFVISPHNNIMSEDYVKIYMEKNPNLRNLPHVQTKHAAWLVEHYQEFVNNWSYLKDYFRVVPSRKK